MEDQSIAFAHYKDDKLLGFRQDTFGTIGKDWAKIYLYSPEQVQTVLKNINSTLGSKKETVGEALKKMGADPVACDLLTKGEQKIYEEGQKARAFEVRVVKGPPAEYEKEFDVKKAEYVTSCFPSYDPDKYKQWIQNPGDMEIIEIHYFSMEGQLNVN